MKIDEKKLIGGLILLHLAIALPLAWKLNIWTDEASTLYTTQHGFIRAFQNLFADEKQAPLYFLLISLWRKLDDSVFFARLFSVLFSLFSIAVFSRLARRVWEEKTAFLMTAVFALHPFLFWASLEIRLYSFIIFIACLLFLFFHDGYLRDDPTDKRARTFYALTAIAAVYTNYYLGFLLAGGFLALLLVRRYAAAKTYFRQMTLVGVAILPLFYVISFQFTERVTRFQPERSLLEGVRILWNHFLTFVLPTEIYPSEAPSAFSLVRLWLVRLSIVGVLLALAKNRFRDLDRIAAAAGTICAVCAAFFLFVYFQLGADYVEIRHAAVVFVAAVVFAGSVLAKVLPKNGWLAAAAAAGVFFTYAMFAMYPNLTKRGDWARVAAFIAEREKPGQPIVFFPAYDALALPYYYRGVNRILPDEKFFAFHAEGEPGSANNFRSQQAYIIGRIPPEAEEIWLLTDENCELKQSCEPLEKFVEANYTITEVRYFYKEKVRLLRKKQR